MTENQFSTFLLYRFLGSASTGNDSHLRNPILYISTYFFMRYYSYRYYFSLSPIFILENTATKIFTNIKVPITQYIDSVVRYLRSKPSFKCNSIIVWLTIKKVAQKLFLKKVDIFMICYRFLLR